MIMPFKQNISAVQKIFFSFLACQWWKNLPTMGKQLYCKTANIFIFLYLSSDTIIFFFQIIFFSRVWVNLTFWYLIYPSIRKQTQRNVMSHACPHTSRWMLQPYRLHNAETVLVNDRLLVIYKFSAGRFWNFGKNGSSQKSMFIWEILCSDTYMHHW